MNNQRRPASITDSDAIRRLYSGYITSGIVDKQQASQSLVGDSGRRPFFDRMIKAYFPTDRSSHIFDFGCGHGALLARAKQLGYLNVSGCDASEEQVRLAHSFGHSEVFLSTGSDSLARFSERFDLIVLLDVIEHLSLGELLTTVDSCYAALRPGGQILIHAPNGEGLSGMAIVFGDLTHFRGFTAGSLTQTLRVCSFDKVMIWEDRPISHGFVSFARLLLWHLLSFPSRILRIAETGSTKHYLTRNLWGQATKPHAPHQQHSL